MREGRNMKTIDRLLYEAKRRSEGFVLCYIEEGSEGVELGCTLPNGERRERTYATMGEAVEAAHALEKEIPSGWVFLVIIDDCGEEEPGETANEVDHAGGGAESALPGGQYGTQ